MNIIDQDRKMVSRNSAGNHRTAGIPLDYVISEFIAYPLISRLAFQNCITDLDPGIGDKTSRLWRGVEKHFLSGVPDLSLDQAISIRDRLWFFHPTSSRVPLHRFLEKTAADFFEVLGGSAAPRGFVRESEGRPAKTHRRNRSLRWLSFSLPTDLLLGALGKGQDPPSRIQYLSPMVFADLKDHGFSENHLHVGAALEFPAYWVAVLHALASPEIKADAFKSPGAEFKEGALIGPWLLRAAIVRYILALFLYEFFSSTFDAADFSDYLEKKALPRISRYEGLTARASVMIVITELPRGAFSRPSPCYAPLRAIYRGMTGLAVMKFPDDPRAVHESDPISRLTPCRFVEESTPELFFIHRGISYLNKHPGDRLFSAMFWQVVRLRGILYRHIVQRPMTPGLQWFIRMYGRIKPGRKKVGFKFLARSAARTSGMEYGLRSLEFRTTPSNRSSENLGLVKSMLEVMEELNRETGWTKKRDDFMVAPTGLKLDKIKDLELAVVLHFAKSRGGGAIKGRQKAFWMGAKADPRVFKNHRGAPILSQCRFSLYYRKKQYEAMGLARTILSFPKCLAVVRGIDICSDELGVPTWVLSPHMRYVKEAGKAASHHLKNHFGYEDLELRTTVHAGEDFVHLLGGLRRVDEAMKHYRLRPGDRIGHGLALGLEPGAWARRMGRVAMYLEDRLFDLVWEWTKYSRRGVPCTVGRLAFVESEIARLTKRVFDESYTPYQMERFARDLHNEEMLRATGYPDYRLMLRGREKNPSREVGPDDRVPFLHRYLTNHNVFVAGREIEWVNVVDEIEPLTALQKYIRENIARIGILVEVNPTSNLLIGNLTDLNNHPLWRLDPPKGDGDSPPVSVCIGSDDPITFATNIRWEYALMRESLVAGGLSNSEACTYLDRIRSRGLSSRFTRLRVGDVRKKSRWRDRDVPSPPCDYYAFGIDRNICLMP